MKRICSISSLLLCNNSVTSIDNTQQSLYMGYIRKVSYSHYSHIQSYSIFNCINASGFSVPRIRVLCSSGSHVCPTGVLQVLATSSPWATYANPFLWYKSTSVNPRSGQNWCGIPLFTAAQQRRHPPASLQPELKIGKKDTSQTNT
jgi:hypothetical protein